MIPSRRGFLSGGLALAGRFGSPGQGAPAPLRVGVVNVRRCFEKDLYVRMKEGLEELGKLRDALTREGEELQKKIAALADLMGRTPRSADLYVEKLRQRAHRRCGLSSPERREPPRQQIILPVPNENQSAHRRSPTIAPIAPEAA